MQVSYSRLWKLLIDKKMNKTALKEVAGISNSTLAKMGKDETVSMEVIQRQGVMALYGKELYRL